MQNWNPYENYVQPGLQDGRYINANMVKVAAGPPRLAAFGGAYQTADRLDVEDPRQLVWPIGCVQNVGQMQNRQWTRVNEIGSDRAYFISGKAMGGLNLSTIYYHGPSLLRVLYAYYKDSVGPTQVQPLFENLAADQMPHEHDVIVPPGYQNLYWNLQSDLFSQPIGLLFYVADINMDTMGANYFESVVVQSHSTGTDSQGIILSEQVQMQYERMVPVAVSSVPVITEYA